MDPIGGPSNAIGAFTNVCLVDSLRSHGIDVAYTKSGPFRALADGNPMLAGFGLQLVPCPFARLCDGKYVLWRAGVGKEGELTSESHSSSDRIRNN